MNLEQTLGTYKGTECAQDGCTVGILAPEVIENWVCAIHRACPRCGSAIMDFPALSRTDNKTKVCSPCGRLEGIEALALGKPLPQWLWQVND